MGQQNEMIQLEQNHNDLPQDYPVDNIIKDIRKGVSTRLNLKDACLNMTFVSQIEPSKI